MTAARTRVRRAEPRPAEPMLLDPARCACRKPTLVATFRREQLVALELRHAWWCLHPAQPIDVETWRKPW